MVSVLLVAPGTGLNTPAPSALVWTNHCTLAAGLLVAAAVKVALLRPTSVTWSVGSVTTTGETATSVTVGSPAGPLFGSSVSTFEKFVPETVPWLVIWVAVGLVIVAWNFTVTLLPGASGPMVSGEERKCERA